MKQKLTERYIIDLMKEEWDKKVHSLLEKPNKQSKKPETGLKVFANIDGKSEDVLSAAVGLKIKKKASKGDPMSGLNYDVVDVNVKDKTVTLSRPAATGGDTKQVIVSLQDFQDNYERE
jgi:hypothetical protein